jgi:hypothetical protein
LNAFVLKDGFILVTAKQALSDFGCLTSSFLNKNYLFKLEVSMQSSSVQKTYPFLEHPTPNNANIFNNSHPKAPAPTKKIFRFSNFIYNSRPNIAVISSYLPFYTDLSTLLSGNASKHS